MFSLLRHQKSLSIIRGILMPKVLKIESHGRMIIGPIDLDVPIHTNDVELSHTSGDGFYLCAKDANGENITPKVTNVSECRKAWDNKVAELMRSK